jgi:hypothetical protein
MTNIEAIMRTADQLIFAADGYADDEMVWFDNERWFAGRLREMADDLIDDNIESWAVFQLNKAHAAGFNY